MKIYVVVAHWCEDTWVCGAALDEKTANLIRNCETISDSADSVWVEEYDTNDYIPMKDGARPYEVRFFPDRTVTVCTSLNGFKSGRIYDNVVGGCKCLSCDVFASNEEYAIKIAKQAVDTYKKRKRIVDSTDYISKKK